MNLENCLFSNNKKMWIVYMRVNSKPTNDTQHTSILNTDMENQKLNLIRYQQIRSNITQEMAASLIKTIRTATYILENYS